MENNKITFDISMGSVIKILALIAGVVFLWAIREILFLFFIVLVIVAALSPVVDRWSKKMNRLLAISLIYLIIMIVIVFMGMMVIPPVVKQVEELASNLPNYINSNLGVFGIWRDLLLASQESLATLAKSLTNFSSQILSTTIGFVGGILASFTVVVLTFYLLLEEHGAKKFVLQYLPLENRQEIVATIQKIGHKMGAWLRGQLTLGLIIAIVDGIGLAILGVPYTITLAVWAGFTELIPYVGPIIGAVPAIIIAFLQSPFLGLLTIALYVVVQQFEASFLVPKIMQKAVGLSPVIIILAILIGAKLAGLAGVVLSIPVAATIGVLVTEYPKYKKKI